jgi:hypothetical protein
VPVPNEATPDSEEDNNSDDGGQDGLHNENENENEEVDDDSDDEDEGLRMLKPTQARSFLHSEVYSRIIKSTIY